MAHIITGEGGGSASPFINTVLLLLAEMARGDASPWAPYIASLPRACDTCLLSWTEEDKKELKGE
jgi:[ribulose-bisphosphate carboxylase]-lysine N-methyltransferase